MLATLSYSSAIRCWTFKAY